MGLLKTCNGKYYLDCISVQIIVVWQAAVELGCSVQLIIPDYLDNRRCCKPIMENIFKNGMMSYMCINWGEL